MDQTFKIPNWRLEGVVERLSKIAKRASKKGLSPFSWSLGNVGKTEKKRHVGESPLHPDGYETYYVEWTEVTISAEPVKLNGWRFMARIQHLTADGETVNLLYAAPFQCSPEGETCIIPAKYQTATPNCDHCKIDRYRRDTFIVIHDDGTVKQVGSTCLSDFLGVNAADFLAAAEYISDAIGCCGGDDDEGFGSGGFCPRAWPLHDILRVAAADVLSRGYWSRLKGEAALKVPTGDLVRNYLTCRKPEQLREIVPPEAFSEKSRKLADDTEKWLVDDLADRDLTKLSDYLRNLAALGKLGFCPYKAVGILAYAVCAWQKDHEQAITATTSKHQGTIGQKLGLTGDFFHLTVKMLRSYESMRGCGTIVKFQDADGNLYIWFSSTPQSQLDLQVGQPVCLIATVKAHDHDRYTNDAPITVLTRPEFDHDRILAAREKEAKRLARVAKQLAKAKATQTA